MHSYFHVALNEVIGRRGKYGDRVETVPTMPRAHLPYLEWFPGSSVLHPTLQIPLRVRADKGVRAPARGDSLRSKMTLSDRYNSLRTILLLGCLSFALAATYLSAAETNSVTKVFVPSTKYATTRVAGWTVRVNRELLTSQSELGSNALALLAVHLREITNTVPARACDALKRIPIWLGVNDGHAPCAEYHPSKDWLAKNGYNPDKAKCVEIGNARKFIQWSAKQPSMILHELAHGYHDQVLGFSNPRVRKAFEQAKADGLYESVSRNNGKTERAYALTDDHEYFAEATEAFFGTNDFYPFTRDQLKEHDPNAYQLLEEVWR
jgi:hypothetical protein